MRYAMPALRTYVLKPSLKNIIYRTGSLLLLVSFFACTNKTSVPASKTEAGELVLIKGGIMQMGAESQTNAYPPVKQDIPDFYIMKYEVTLLLFSEFVASTGYVTSAEKKGGSYVFFRAGKPSGHSIPGTPWWQFVEGACWQFPEGKNNLVPTPGYYPVTHISYVDACAFCEWMDMRLPTEAEWEYAARADGEKKAGQRNIWEGVFPVENTLDDGFEGTSPAGSFPAGKAGLHDISGNVWEWCSDRYHEGWYILAQDVPLVQRRYGPKLGYDPTLPYGETFVIRGGSYLCAENYCTGYLPFTRMRSDTSMTFGHIGFRCARSR